eukprot:CAMPEP_0201508256 /NCGR_PEP_ID=MMETSP0161_2-20130828/1662_1 /ASSEMBLY_ACC=CAM_ASM_000251 /TAXON_ID=180227 /ORGANISM="Neoparamoeba aestuarina, Strain SoJaBio B1-5/56/2" /LENGTH=342 /DNA_ID=CAMNT_0047902855 /DNA_START=76 /DNA_END=1101 /DNA_ORIENTATION=-
MDKMEKKKITKIVAASVAFLFLAIVFSYHQNFCGISYPPPNFSPSSPPPAVLVTGASRGVGKDIAIHLAESGFVVFAGVRKTEDGVKLVTEYHNQVGDDKKNRIRPLHLDVTEHDDVDRTYQAINAMDVAKEIAFHGIVHNAAVIEGGPMESLASYKVEKVIDVNFRAPILLTHAFLPLLRHRQGRVVFVSSLGEIMPFGFHGPYEATKRGLSAFADLLRREMNPFKVYVGAVLPGLMETDMFYQAMDEHTVGEALPGELNEIYKDFYSEEACEYRRKYLYNLVHDPRECSEAVLHSLTSSTPHTSYLVGPHAIAGKMFRLLPDWFLDRQAQVLFWPGPLNW